MNKDPLRFMAVLDDGSVLKSSNEPAEVQGAPFEFGQLAQAE